MVICILNHSRINSLSFFSVSGESKDSFDSTVVLIINDSDFILEQEQEQEQEQGTGCKVNSCRLSHTITNTFLPAITHTGTTPLATSIRKHKQERRRKENDPSLSESSDSSMSVTLRNQQKEKTKELKSLLH